MGKRPVPNWWIAFKNEGRFAGACIVSSPNLKSALINVEVQQLASGEPVEAIAFDFDVPAACMYRKLTAAEVVESDGEIFKQAAEKGAYEPVSGSLVALAPSKRRSIRSTASRIAKVPQ